MRITTHYLYCNIKVKVKLYCNIKVKLWFSRIKGSRSLTDVSSMFGMDLAISSSEKGMLESSSRRTEKLETLFGSSRIVALMLDMNSAEVTFVPFTSSQYIPTILSSCCKLRSGQISLRISSHVLIGFREIT